eukprot:PhM_4_TR10378/c0_g1_i1/m.83994
MGRGDVQYDKPKHTVINEKLITECIHIPPSMMDEEKRSRDRAAEVRRDHLSQLEFHEVEWLIFSYKRIAHIDNLIGFANLKRLQLDNNDITKIEHLGHLTQLVWLDLSFNQITKIENLDALVNLEDLSLFSNQIKEIEGLDNLKKLTCLSLGKNQIESLDEIPKLHKFKSLRMLTLSGNAKICAHPSYKSRILAYVRSLKFLDAKMVLPEEVAKGLEETRELLINQEETDRKEEEEARTRAEQDKEEAEFRRANLGGIRRLFEDVMREEPQVEHRSIAAFAALEPQGAPLRDEITRYDEQFGVRLKEFIEKMKEHRSRKDDEARDYSLTMEGLKKETDDRCKAHIKDYEREKKKYLPAGIKVFKDDFKATPQDLQQLKSDLDELRDRLLDMETDQQEANLDLIEAYDRHLEQIKTESVECIQTTFEELRNMERNFRDAVQKIFDTMVEDRTKESQNAGDGTAYTATVEASADTKATLALLDSKDEWTKMLAEAHEARNKRLEETEEALKVNEEKERTGITEGNYHKEHTRNRTRVNEVVQFVELMLQQIAEWERK